MSAKGSRLATFRSFSKSRSGHLDHRPRNSSHWFVLICLIALVALYLLLMNDTIRSLAPICAKMRSIAGCSSRSSSSNTWRQVAGNKSSSSSRDQHHHYPDQRNDSSHVSLRRRLPNCIIVGARKCGTRALLEFLDIHPQIRKATDELHFFDDDRRYDLGLEWYAAQMPPAREDDVVIEKTPAYFVTEYAPERIYAMNGSIKIILIVRDPVTRLISDYAQLASNRAAKNRDRNGRRIEQFENVIMLPNGRINSNYKAIRISLYAVYFSRWVKLFSKRQIHVVDGDQFVYDPLVELQKVEQFLGLPPRITRDHFIYNTTKGFYCVRQPEMSGGERCLNKNKGRKHPDIDPAVIRRLRRFYDPYNKYFYKLVGRKFAWPE